MKNKYLLILLWQLLFSFCHSTHNKVFVSTKNNQDTLILNNNGKYLRIIKYNGIEIKDTGNWFLEDNRIWLYDWEVRGEIAGFGDRKLNLVAFSFKKSLFGNISKIYFDVDNYYYYQRIE